MSPGAVLVGLAAAVVLVTYVARPFRKSLDVDRDIEAWVAAISAGGLPTAPDAIEPEAVTAGGESPEARGELAEAGAVMPEPAREPVSAPEKQPQVTSRSDVAFCHQCGRGVKPHHRFCPRCGVSLIEDEV